MKGRDFYKFHSQLALPFLETNREHLNEMFKTLVFKFNLKKNSKQKLIDLGAGDGRIVIFAALNYGIKSLGIEINSNLIQEAKEKIKLLKKEISYSKRQFRKIKIKQGDFFLQNVEKFDFIYIYSLPNMQKYLNHIFLTAKKSAIVISYRYPLINFEMYLKLEYELVCINDHYKTFIFFYRKI